MKKHNKVAVIFEWVQFNMDPNTNLDLACFKYVLFDDGLNLKGAVGQWHRYALYWVPL